MLENDQDSSDFLTTKQQTFIDAMLCSPSIAAAAQHAGIADKTARRWLALPHIKQAIEQARQEMFRASLAELKDAVRVAVQTLKSQMTDEESPASVRVRAAEIVLKNAIEVNALQELEAKIAELEEMIKHGSANPTYSR